MELINRSILLVTFFTSLDAIQITALSTECETDLVQCIADQVFTKLKSKFLSLEEKNQNLERAVNLLKQQMQVQQNRKEFRCESGSVGQAINPAPAWPYTANVTFQSPFEQAPTVTYGLYFLDNGWDKNIRVNTDVSSVTSTGFHINVFPWADTVLYGARIRWMACGK
ncbi:uncharacterized protein LOC144621934 [Crassostrea virginica]